MTIEENYFTKDALDNLPLSVCPPLNEFIYNLSKQDKTFSFKNFEQYERKQLRKWVNLINIWTPNRNG